MKKNIRLSNNRSNDGRKQSNLKPRKYKAKRMKKF